MLTRAAQKLLCSFADYRANGRDVFAFLAATVRESSFLSRRLQSGSACLRVSVKTPSPSRTPPQNRAREQADTAERSGAYSVALSRRRLVERHRCALFANLLRSVLSPRHGIGRLGTKNPLADARGSVGAVLELSHRHNWVGLLLACLLLAVLAPVLRGTGSSPITFSLQLSPFRLENAETEDRHLPAAMAGGVAVFDYNGDGRPDIFFTNGANLATLKKDDPKYSNRLFRNDGNGVFTDVTEKAGLTGTGYDMGVAVGDFDNDGRPDLFVAGVHHNTLYHNNGDGTFTDVTVKAGLNHSVDPKYGPVMVARGGLGGRQ